MKNIDFYTPITAIFKTALDATQLYLLAVVLIIIYIISEGKIDLELVASDLNNNVPKIFKPILFYYIQFINFILAAQITILVLRYWRENKIRKAHNLASNQ